MFRQEDGMTAAPPSLRPHTAIRIDAWPPAADHERRFYWCSDGCGYLNAAELRDSAIVHLVPDPDTAVAEHYSPGSVVTARTGPSTCPAMESPAA